MTLRRLMTVWLVTASQFAHHQKCSNVTCIPRYPSNGLSAVYGEGRSSMCKVGFGVIGVGCVLSRLTLYGQP